MKIILTGASGFVGSRLYAALKASGHEVWKLVRVRADLLEHEIGWDPERGVITPSLLEGFDAIVHLAGENIMGRWTARKKNLIRSTRVQGTRHLVEALLGLKNPPSAFISASAIGYYGDRGNEILTEESPKGKGFLSDVCAEWEKETARAAVMGIRTVSLRFGMVLSEKGGALKQMLPLFKWGLGGQMGDGSQYVSWITLQDLIHVIEFSIKNSTLLGPVNCVAPFSVTNREFTQELGTALHRPTFMRMPASVVKLIFGELGEELFLSSARAEPKKLLDAGFRFEYPRLAAILSNH